MAICRQFGDAIETQTCVKTIQYGVGELKKQRGPKARIAFSTFLKLIQEGHQSGIENSENGSQTCFHFGFR